MSINFADSFNRYGTDASLMLNGLWNQVAASLVADPSGGGNHVLAPDGTAHANYLPVTDIAATAQGIACRIWATALAGAQGIYIGWFDDRAIMRAMFSFSSSGRVAIYKSSDDAGSGIVKLAESTFPAITANAWWHCEFKVHFGTAGTCTAECRVEGITVLNATGLDFTPSGSANPTPYLVGIGNNHSVQNYIKDWVVWDTNGSANNNFLGSVQVFDLDPVADVALNWTVTGGTTGFGVLSNNPPDDTKYISAAWPAPSAYKASFSALPDNISSIKAVIGRYRAAKIDGGDGQIQAAVISNTTTQNGANRPITVAETYYDDIYEVDPHTTAAWTVDAVNAVNMSLNRTV